jgi:hypothetical protein
MFKASQKFIIVFIFVAITLVGCSLFSSNAPQSNQPVVTENQREADLSTGRDEASEAAQSAAATSVEEKAVEVEEPAAPPVVADKVEAVTEAESGYRYDDADGAGGPAAVEPMFMPTASPALSVAEPAVAGEVMAGAEGEAGAAPLVQQSEPLKAGEVDDNAQWDDYLLYRRNYRGPYIHDRDISERYIIEVVDGQGRPVLGANVRVSLPGHQQEVYSAQTYATGQVLFHPLALAEISLEQVDRFVVEVQKDNLLEQFSLTRFDAQATTAFADRWTVTLDLPQQQFESLNLDVLFLIDATGSMADEIQKIQSTIFDVSAQIDALPENPNARYGMVTYRDRGDSFVTRTYEFTPDVRDFSENLNTVYADGGDDYPESLNEGLREALRSVEWRSEDTVKLIFLIADAPPHLDYPQDYDYAVEMDTAARRGIKIFPIASSGLDDQGEYIFRQIAQYTQGRFIFLTYDGPTNGGSPGETTTHHVDDYSVENLDELLVRLVEEELAYQNPQVATAQ